MFQLMVKSHLNYPEAKIIKSKYRKTLKALHSDAVIRARKHCRCVVKICTITKGERRHDKAA